MESIADVLGELFQQIESIEYPPGWGMNYDEAVGWWRCKEEVKAIIEKEIETWKRVEELSRKKSK